MCPNHALRPRLELAPSAYPGRSISTWSESPTLTLKLGREKKQEIWMKKELVGSRRMSDEEKLTWDEEEQAWAMGIAVPSAEGVASLGVVENMALTEEVSFLFLNNLEFLDPLVHINFSKLGYLYNF